MRGTPQLPDWLRSFRTPNYTNIYELIPEENRLYGTESLFGDWDAEVLLLAKDFGTSQLVRERMAAGDSRPYRHEDKPRHLGYLTNRNLLEFATPLGGTLLYGSAMVGLLRNDGETSGWLRDRSAVKEFVTAALQFTLTNMPRLRAVACLGVDAWSFSAQLFDTDPQAWAVQRESRAPHMHGSVAIFALTHPSRQTGGKLKVLQNWRALGDWLRLAS